MTDIQTSKTLNKMVDLSKCIGCARDILHDKDPGIFEADAFLDRADKILQELVIQITVSGDYKYIAEKLFSLGGQIGSRKGYIRSHPQKNARFPVWYIQSDDEGNLYRDWTYTPGVFEIWFRTKEDCQRALDSLTDQDKEIIRNLEV